VIPLWRLTRNRYARRVYDALAAVGVTATRMVEFEAPAGDAGAAVDPPGGVAVEAVPAGDAADRYDMEFPIPASPLDGEWVVVARDGDRAVGRALVSAGREPYVEPLGTSLSFDGAYVRRVYVDRERRNEGIAKRLVGETLAVAREEFGVDTAHALIAADNRPSQWVFEANGFRPVRRHDYLRAFGLERRRTTRADP
jgi:GNAT superfamily N-acetyltransferase